MLVREQVQSLVQLGPLPAEQAVIADPTLEDRVAQVQTLLEALAPPVSREEAEVLMQLFGPDSCFGLAWALVHLIESAPGGAPIGAQPPADANAWVRLLWDRLQRANAWGMRQKA